MVGDGRDDEQKKYKTWRDREIYKHPTISG